MEFVKVENKYYLNGKNQRELCRKSFIEICRIVVREISPVKPENINSVSKLLKIIEYELVPDSSDEEVEVKKPPKKLISQKTNVRKPPPKAPLDSDNESDETDDE